MTKPRFYLSRRLAISIIFAMCSTLLIPATARADAPTFGTSDNGDGTVTITGCVASCSADLAIPESIDSKPVKAIGNFAFMAANLKSVTIPNSVTEIGDQAFYGNQLTALLIPDSVTRIGQAAFMINQVSYITIPRSVASIGGWAFMYNSLTSVTFLGDAPLLDTAPNFFNGNPDSLTITVPSDATGFGETYASLTFSRTGPPIHTPIFTSSGNGDGTLTITGCPSNCAGNLVVPETISGKTVTAIGSYALSERNLTSVSIPNSVTAIGLSAFRGNDLATVNIPDSVIWIGNFAFEGNALTSLVLGKSVTRVGNHAFDGNQLTAVAIPNSVTSLGDSAFANNKLTSVSVGTSVTRIGQLAFSQNSLSLVTFLGDAPSEGGDLFLIDEAYSSLTSVVIPRDAIGFGAKYSDVPVSRTGAAIHAVTPSESAPSYTSGAKITGKAKIGKTLTVSIGAWTSNSTITYTYQWYTCNKPTKSVLKTDKVPAGCKVITMATKAKLKITAKQKKSFIAVMISATNSVNTSKIVTASLGKVK